MGCCCSTDIINNKTLDNIRRDIDRDTELNINLNNKTNNKYLPYYFIFLNELEVGATSKVCKARDINGNKLICKRVNRKYIKKSLVEINILKKITSNKGVNLPEYVYNYQDELYINIFMKDVGGMDLFIFLQTICINNIVKEKIIYNMLSCIITLHKYGYMHLDIKLENFIIYSNYKIMLIDFGCCHKRGIGLSDILTETGTIGYNAPEIYNYKYHKTSDFWSWAICIWIMYLNDSPFNFKNPTSDIDKEFIFPNKHHIKSLDIMVEEQRELFTGIFKSYDKRYDIEDIIKNKWIKSI
jgi:serine/threonine protein kinase